MNFVIPKHMDGEQSKLAAKIIMAERAVDLANAKIFAARNRIIMSERDLALANAKIFGAKNEWNRLYKERGQGGNAAGC